jgi:hypothetical protein
MSEHAEHQVAEHDDENAVEEKWENGWLHSKRKKDNDWFPASDHEVLRRLVEHAGLDKRQQNTKQADQKPSSAAPVTKPHSKAEL